MGLYGNLWSTENESGTVTLWATADGAQKMKKGTTTLPFPQMLPSRPCEAHLRSLAVPDLEENAGRAWGGEGVRLIR